MYVLFTLFLIIFVFVCSYLYIYVMAECVKKQEIETYFIAVTISGDKIWEDILIRVLG